MSDTQVVDDLLHPQVGTIIDEAAVRSRLGTLAPQQTVTVNIDAQTFQRLTNIANLLRSSITTAEDTASAGEQALFLLDSIVNPHLHLDAARAAEWRLAVEPDTTDSPIDSSVPVSRRATKDGKSWQERQRTRQQQYEKDMKSIAVMLKDYTTFATAKDVPWGLCRWLSTPEFAGVIVRAIKQAARLSYTRVPFPGTSTSRQEASDRLVGILKRASVLGGDRYTRIHIGKAVSEAAEWDRQVLSMAGGAAGGQPQKAAQNGAPPREEDEEEPGQGESQRFEAETPKPSDAQPKARPAGRAAAAAAAAKAQYADPASEDEHSDGASAKQAERGPTPRNRASTSGGMAGPSKPKAQKRKQATSDKVGGRGKKREIVEDEEGQGLDDVVPSSKPASDAGSEEEEEPAPKKRRLDKGKGKAIADSPKPTATEEWTFDFPMVKISTDVAFLPEDENGQVDLSALPRTLDTPCLHFSLAKIASLTAEQSRAVARERVRTNLPPFEDESALLQAMDKPSVERLALDLHSLAEEATTQLRHDLGSLLALANFQRQHIERCHAAMNARDVPIPTMAQEQQGGADGLSVE